MAPYRIHLLEGAFISHADSGLIRAGVDDLERLAPNTRMTRRFQAAEELAFGDTAGHAALVTELLDPANGNLGGQVSSALSHPRFAEVKQQLGRRAYAQAPANIRQLIVRDLGFSLMYSRGSIAEGLEAFRDPVLEPREWGETVLETYLFGIPITPDLLARAEAVTELNGESTFVVAAYAATREQWDAHAQGVTVLRTRSDSLGAAGDTVAARRTRADAQLLEGFGLWRRGQAGQAVRVMDAARVQIPNQVDHARWWLGQLHLEAGRWTEAEPYFDSFMRYEPDPLATYYLAQIHERTGRREHARALYAFFAEHWAGADAALQPRVDDARQRLSTLSDDAGR
jgi:tetratricopeptide (TPR) repeat protein